MSRNKTGDTPNIGGKTALCAVLAFLLTLLLLCCISVRQHVMRNDLPKAASAVMLDRVTVKNASGASVSLARLITEDYIADPGIGEEQMKTVLREGTFHYLLGDKVNEYNAWLAAGGEGTFPQVTVDECIDALKGNATLLYRETHFQLSGDSEATFRQNLEQKLPGLNDKLSRILETGFVAFLLKGCIAGWLCYIPAALLLVLFVWMIVFHVKGKRFAGKGIRTFSVSVLIPCLLLVIWGIFSALLLGNTAYGDAAKQLRETWLTVGGIGALGGIVLYGFGMICKLFEKKDAIPAEEDYLTSPEAESEMPSAPAPEAKPSEEVPEQPATRHFCRFCGEPLVNSDAKFCYKCGTPQEKPKSEN